MKVDERSDPHAMTPVHQAGAELEGAEGVVILLHGRGGLASDILGLQAVMAPPLLVRRVAWLAPEAAGNSWYPESFLAPRGANEPYLASALKKIRSLIALAGDAGIAPEHIVIGGFSQGACLSTEFVASHPAQYAGLIAFTGGLVGPPGTSFTQTGDLGGMPALLLSGDPDPHVPWTRVQESAEVLSRMGAQVTVRKFPGRPHTVSREEVALGREMIGRVFGW